MIPPTQTNIAPSSSLATNNPPVLLNNTYVDLRQFMGEVRSTMDAQAQKISALEAEIVQLKEEKKTQQEALTLCFNRVYHLLQDQYASQSEQLVKLQTQVSDLEYENYASKPWAIKDPNHYERPFRGIHWK